MGLKYREYLEQEEGKKLFGCSTCHSHLATSDKIVSKEFNGQHGPAYLFQKVVNVDEDDIEEERMMISGTHTIVTISCTRCLTLLGWKYVKASDDRQKFKEGKYILEKTLLKIIQ
ncbi:yippee-like protein [Halteromyces radiatus]|uniref:yippee-like protein n=1 Tax=Halteromyces radiatus TaxID=101107 RepID=UPI00221E6036|nr:yippee-like protein [Halteromyces radiatus]KAI8093374.1 yippee-like protein [Halteromyces radiatus]